MEGPGAVMDGPAARMERPARRREDPATSPESPHAAMNWDEGAWDSGQWDSPEPAPYFQPKPKKQTHMKRQNYYPSRIGDQVNWLDNFATKLPIHGSTLGASGGDVTAAVNDAKWGNYVLGSWLTAVRAFAPSTTDAVDRVLTGEGAATIVLPTFTAPTLPAGVTAALPGALSRLFALITRMKTSPNYTEDIGTDLGVVGSEETQKATPKFTAETMDGTPCQCVKLVFYKYGHMGVHIESRRGANGAWEFLTVDTESPYLDERPLLVAGQPEVREYRMRFWDKGTPNGDWTDVVKVTVSL